MALIWTFPYNELTLSLGRQNYVFLPSFETSVKVTADPNLVPEIKILKAQCLLEGPVPIEVVAFERASDFLRALNLKKIKFRRFFDDFLLVIAETDV